VVEYFEQPIPTVRGCGFLILGDIQNLARYSLEHSALADPALSGWFYKRISRNAFQLQLFCSSAILFPNLTPMFCESKA